MENEFYLRCCCFFYCEYTRATAEQWTHANLSRIQSAPNAMNDKININLYHLHVYHCCFGLFDRWPSALPQPNGSNTRKKNYVDYICTVT